MPLDLHSLLIPTQIKELVNMMAVESSECSDRGCNCSLKTLYVYNGDVLSNSRLNANVTQKTIDLRIRIENIGTQPFYPIISPGEKRKGYDGHMIIKSEVDLDLGEGSSNCRNESGVRS